MKQQVVAVTGATGFLGRHIVAAFAEAGATMRLLVRRDPDFPLAPGTQLIRGGLEDAAACAALAAGATAIIHAAGLIKARNGREFFRVNQDGTRHLAETTRRLAPASRFVLVSSLAARAPELSPYAASKRAGELAAQTAYAGALEQLMILRPAAIYGPWDRENLPIFKTAARRIAPYYGPGRVAFIHAKDAAAAILHAALGPGAGCYALSDDNPAGYRADEIVAEAARALDAPPPRRIPIPASLLLAAGHASGAFATLRGRPSIFTAGKAREMLHPDWSVHPDEVPPADIHRPEISLAPGFRATVAWYRAAGWMEQ